MKNTSILFPLHAATVDGSLATLPIAKPSTLTLGQRRAIQGAQAKPRAKVRKPEREPVYFLIGLVLCLAGLLLAIKCNHDARMLSAFACSTTVEACK